ncbi:MAG TPA: radical SAM protein [Pyrinomonadaceae bacterium]|nr:radical SAM protein [Pyrinomonadaceae bacterium]
MNLITRIARHARLNWQSLDFTEVPSPPFVILFINSICNMKCEHCFYWQNLNRPDDLSFDEMVDLSHQLGRIENLNLSGGEPFLRKDFGPICRQFIRHNKVKEIYVPSNGYFTERTVEQIRETLKEESLRLFVIELSLDGMPEFHDKFRVTRNSFKRAMETYDALVDLQQEDPRLQIHSISTATADNMDEIRCLTTFLFERCPKMAHHNLALIRGDRKNPSLQGPKLAEYVELAEYVKRLWAPREQRRYGSVVEPMLQWAKVKTAEEQTQVIPCKAGVLSTVIYSNGDVSVCEAHAPLGNIRDRSFREIWYSDEARQLRASIRAKECYCTNEIFLWPSITFQPRYLTRALVGAKVWRKATPLPAGERADWRKPRHEISLPVLQLTREPNKLSAPRRNGK